MNVEIISVGTELLLGDILNTNAQYLSKELALLGINVFSQMTVGDNIERLKRCFEFAFKRADVIITTGGLGPTTDDITKEAAASYFEQEMFIDDESWEKIQNKCIKFSGNKGSIPQNNIRQAMFPKEAIIIPNNNGTAPGAIFEKNGKKIIVMPGPPREMKAMFVESILPILKNGSGYIIDSKYLRFFGIGESALEIKLINILDSQTNPTVALYAKEGEVLVRVTAMCNTQIECDKLLNEKIAEIKNICGEYIYLIGGDEISSSQTELDNVVGKMLVESNLKIAVAESCTGGLVSSCLINYPGISKVFLEGCIAYSNEAKVDRLSVKLSTLKKYGAVSHETAKEMAIGIAKNMNANIGVSTTGIAGPGGGSNQKPVGLVYIGIYINGNVYSFEKVFPGDRRKIRERATREALNLIRLQLLKSRS
ncbi:competence/damage-inducible protein A [Peptostreptococcus canis]|uniref:Putative competence-damage inducible protein n=1 Tax=Peptostreptococcus canis TaxID=1159213 RepID=A0ABR6TK44_9FIRM|nr:competence/damage-inducible protein A [Peptostreptococcus canis]MBC2575772.1 competence/damage-inducible protein A [Peptostreptococcus canis]MBP1998113.1 nicotinamide-nucleotide amidase [Peptostreptococcus canis]